MLISLTYLPVDDILIEITHMYTTFSQELLSLISYFDKSYISDNNPMVPLFYLECNNNSNDE